MLALMPELKCAEVEEIVPLWSFNNLLLLDNLLAVFL